MRIDTPACITSCINGLSDNGLGRIAGFSRRLRIMDRMFKLEDRRNADDDWDWWI